MYIRELNENDARPFYDCLKAIDQETEYMMFEPDERVWHEDGMRERLRNKDNLIIGAMEGEKIVGFLSAERGAYRRNRHSAYIVVGIQKEYQHQGIGTGFFQLLDDWARQNQISRLELTVEIPNTAAIQLYKKRGFVIEGIKKSSMVVRGKNRDEYMMAKLYG